MEGALQDDEGSSQDGHQYHSPYELAGIDDTAQDNLRTEQSSQLSAAAGGDHHTYQHAAGRPEIGLQNDRSPTPPEQQKRQQYAAAQASSGLKASPELVLGPPPGAAAAEHRASLDSRAVAFLLEEPRGGSDTVRVRELLLGDGQRATVIMEDGRIKRIVTAHGQIAEVRWQSSEPRPNSNEGRLPLTVNLTSPVSRQRVSIDSGAAASMPALPNMLSHPPAGPAARAVSIAHAPMTPTSRRAALQTAPSSYGRESQDRRAHSMNDVTWDGGRGGAAPQPARQGTSRMQSLQTAPMHSNSSRELTADNAERDMPTIMESTSQVPKNWNPVKSNWLPREMTANAGRPATSGSQQPLSATSSSSRSFMAERPGTAPSANGGMHSQQALHRQRVNDGRPSQPLAGDHARLAAPDGAQQQHSSRDSGQARRAQSISQAQPSASPAGSSRRHSVEGDAVSKRPGWWKRLRHAVFPTMNLRKNKEGKPMSVDHGSPAGKAAPSQKFTRDEVVQRGATSRTRAQSRREALTSGWAPEQQQQQQHVGQPSRATLAQDRAGAVSPGPAARNWRRPSEVSRRDESELRASRYAAADAQPQRLSRDRSNFAMEAAANADGWQQREAPPAQQQQGPARQALPHSHERGEQAPAHDRHAEEPRAQVQRQQQDEQLGSSGHMPVTPTRAMQEADLLPRRPVSQRPTETSLRYDSLQSVDPGALSWADKAPQEEKQRPSLLQADDSALETEGAHRRRERRRRERLSQEQAPVGALTPGTKRQTGMAGKWRKNMAEGTSGAQVDELLQMSSLQRLAHERVSELEIVEADDTLEIIWHICLNNGASRISKAETYDKTGEVVEGPRRDGRPGILRSQLTLTLEGHVHIRSLQNEPFAAVFHDRFKLSTGARRIKFDQKFQLLAPGVLPIKHYSIWHRVNEE